MFLRFYSQTESNVDKCISELKPFMTGLKTITKGKITNSVNVAIPKETTTEKNIEVTITFDTKENEAKFHDNPKCFAIYQRYMTGGTLKGATAEKRNKGDPVYHNPLAGQMGSIEFNAAGIPGLIGVHLPSGANRLKKLTKAKKKPSGDPPAAEVKTETVNGVTLTKSDRVLDLF